MNKDNGDKIKQKNKRNYCEDKYENELKSQKSKYKLEKNYIDGFFLFFITFFSFLKNIQLFITFQWK